MDRIITLDTIELAQSVPTSANIFSLFYDGKFVTTDLSVCMDRRFDKVVEKNRQNTLVHLQTSYYSNK